MSHGRKIRDAEDARAALEAIARSGCDRVSWARANHIDARSLNAWRVNLSRGDPPALRLVELVTVTPTPAKGVPRGSGCTVRFGDFTVDIDLGVDEPTLVRVLRAVRSC